MNTVIELVARIVIACDMINTKMKWKTANNNDVLPYFLKLTSQISQNEWYLLFLV